MCTTATVACWRRGGRPTWSATWRSPPVATDIVLLDVANQTLDPYDAHGTPLGRRSVALTASTALSLGSDGSVL
ncbi:MAG: hypothetical protein QOF26_2046, partial [Baekduia sp.]|nr:hypothetical protein [Baekduia sp.]